MMDLFSSFDFSVLAEPEFKEDAVREELIAPIIRELGYPAFGCTRVIRSKNLIHPFVHIGTKPHKVSIIPDYTFIVEGRPRWILDAKAPGKCLTDRKNLEQAYSYAIHPEIRVEYYALCNGREFVLFHISYSEPIIKFPLTALRNAWPCLMRFLSPAAFTHPFRQQMKPDFGLHLKMLGLGRKDVITHFFMENIRFVGRIKNGRYTVSGYMSLGNEEFAISFDFDEDRYGQFLAILPKARRSVIREALSEQPYGVDFSEDNSIVVSIAAHIGNEIFSNENEKYLPFIVDKFY